MIKNIQSIAFAFATLLAPTLSLTAQTSADAAAKAQAPDDVRLVKVATLNSVEANQEFQRNVQIMQAAREQAIKLKTAAEKEFDPAKRKDIEKQLDDKIKEINANNQKMVEAYGFSLNRNYVMVIETAHIYMQVSEEEAEKIKKEMDKQEAAGKTTDASSKAKDAPVAKTKETATKAKDTSSKK